jgi:bifunctional DNA-binding transcriptional regulator/antitoxin component of YhaV-PrlF toxin-antitoxin module
MIEGKVLRGGSILGEHCSLPIVLTSKAAGSTLFSMSKIALTTKRQATLPKQLCDELHVGPGDHLDLERRTLDGEVVWLLRAPGPDWSWVGSAKRYARGKSHDVDDIRASIARGRARERR